MSDSVSKPTAKRTRPVRKRSRRRKKVYPYKPFPGIPNIFLPITDVPENHRKINVDDILANTITGYSLFIRGQLYWFSKKDVKIGLRLDGGLELIYPVKKFPNLQG